MADQERPPVGSVAEEAARLLDALGGWAGGHGYAGGPAPGDGSPSEDPGEGSSQHCPTCGARNGAGEAVVCQLCPVCQGIGLLRSVRPETVDRLADLAGALAATLRDAAAQRRAGPQTGPDGGSAGGSAGGPAGGPTGGDRSPRVHDIPVRDEEDTAP